MNQYSILILFHLLIQNSIAGELNALTDDHLNGLVSFHDCSGVVVQLGTSEKDNAIVLTAAHCLSYSNLRMINDLIRNQAYFNKALPVPKTVFVNNPEKVEDAKSNWMPRMHRYSVPKVLYSTLLGRDIALLELPTSVEALRKLGVKVRKLSQKKSVVHQDVFITSSYRSLQQNCRIGIVPRYYHSRSEVMTGVFESTSVYPLIMEPGCLVIGGWSGSPVLDAHDDTVIGVVSSSQETDVFYNFGDFPKLSFKVPEGYDAGSTLIASSIEILNTCLTPEGSLDLSLKSCELALPAPGASRLQKDPDYNPERLPYIVK